MIMNTDHYVKMIMNQLNDSTTYRITKANCDNKVMTELDKLVKRYNKLLTKQEAEYLSTFSYITSNFYGLPKIHKSTMIAEAIKNQNCDCINLLEPDDLKLRPIVAGPNCPTRPLSNLIEVTLVFRWVKIFDMDLIL